MPTSRTQREPPERIFEHYVLTRTVGQNSGLCEIDDSKFESLPVVSSGATAIGISSELTPIGFDFEFDQRIYRRIIISTTGWVGLADPTAIGANQVGLQLLPAGNYERNDQINTNITSHSVLLAAYFDELRNLRNSTT